MNKYYIFIYFLIAAQQGFAQITPTELLDRYRQGQEDIQVFINKGEIVEKNELVDNGNIQPPTWNRFFFELMSDGTRFDLSTKNYFSLNSEDEPLDDSKVRASRSIWNGEKYYYHRVSQKDFIHYPAIISQENKLTNDSLAAHSAGVLLGTFKGDNKRVDSILREAKSMEIRDDMEQIDGYQTYVLDADTDHGKYTLWIDPERGYHIVKAQSLKRGSDIWHDRPLNDLIKPIPKDIPDTLAKELEKQRAELMSMSDIMTEFSFSLDNLSLEKINGHWVPINANYKVVSRSSKGNVGTASTNYRVTSMDLAPDFDAVGAFIPDIPEGAPVSLDDQIGVKYKWSNGSVVPDIDELVVAQIDQEVEKLLSQGGVPALTPNKQTEPENILPQNQPTDQLNKNPENQSILAAAPPEKTNASNTTTYIILVIIVVGLLVLTGFILLRRQKSAKPAG